MKKTAEVFLLVGTILAFLGAIGYLIFGILFVSLGSGSFHADIINYIQQNNVVITDGARTLTPDEAATIMEAVSVGFGVTIFLLIPLAIVSGILPIFARKALLDGKATTKKLSILCIVFGVLGGSICTTVGGILGTIYSAKNL